MNVRSMLPNSLVMFNNAKSKNEAKTRSSRMVEINTSEIRFSRFQTRIPGLGYVSEEIRTLAESIKTNGLIHPPQVTPFHDPDESKYRYELLSGH